MAYMGQQEGVVWPLSLWHGTPHGPAVPPVPLGWGGASLDGASQRYSAAPSRRAGGPAACDPGAAALAADAGGMAAVSCGASALATDAGVRRHRKASRPRFSCLIVGDAVDGNHGGRQPIVFLVSLPGAP